MATERQYVIDEAEKKTMSGIHPVHRVVTTTKTVPEVRQHINAVVQARKGVIAHFDGNVIVCDFGSLMKSKLLGELWVSKSTLPARATILLARTDDGETQGTLDVVDTHRYRFKVGFVKKYQDALRELANSILLGLP